MAIKATHATYAATETYGKHKREMVMTILTPLAVNAISHAFVDITKDGVKPENICLGFDTSNWLNNKTTDLLVNITLEIPKLPDYLHNKLLL